MNLNAFLNPVKEENIKYIASKRFLDEDGKPIEWEIKSITTAEDESLRNACQKLVRNGKKLEPLQELDTSKYLGKLAAACTVEPNLNDAELQKAYGVLGADNLLKTMLKPGEYSAYLLKVQEINGYGDTMEDLVEEAKN